MRDLKSDLDARKSASLYRQCSVNESGAGTHAVVDGQELLNFCSNDYLGLAKHPEIIKAMQKGADAYGVGSGAAHLVSGHCRAHQALEEELADFTGYPRALLFSTGYMANLGVISALLGPGDLVLEDRLNHASLLDAALLSRARLSRYQHNSIDDVNAQLQKSNHGERLIVTDGVFSMDGDIVHLPLLAEVAEKNMARLMIDDAHGFGVLGPNGEGTRHHFDISTAELPIYMATLGKAAGVFGAFVAGSDDLIETIIQFARSYIYTTALPPALAEATRASLKIIQSESWRRQQLQQHIQQFRKGVIATGLKLMPSETAIQPIVVGSAEKAVRMSSALRQRGIWVSAIRPPTVPEGTARLRVTLSAEHTEAEVSKLIDAITEVATL